MRFFKPNRAGRRRDSGQVLVLFVLSMIVLILFIGLGVDLGFSYITQAELSKAVDSAALTAVRNIGQGTNIATQLALNAFANNYGISSRDVADPNVLVQIFNDANNNEVVSINATVSINTFFIRVLPQWATLTVASNAQATRNNVSMTLVLDTSGSMSPDRGAPPQGDGSGSGGGQFLPGAVTAFINNFDENHDKAAVVTFSTIVTNAFFGGLISQPVPTSPFKDDIITTVNALNPSGWNGYTFSQGGLTNALLVENDAPTVQGVVKIVVFCTDGRANIIQNTFNCPPVTTYNIGGRDTCPNAVHFFDPITGTQIGDVDVDGGTPAFCEGATGFPSATTGNMQPFLCTSVNAEAQTRAIQVANQMRAQGIIVYSIGVGSGLTPDLGFLGFLQQVANDPDGPNYEATSFDGVAVVANDPSNLQEVFQEIASKILLRLSQ